MKKIKKKQDLTITQSGRNSPRISFNPKDDFGNENKLQTALLMNGKEYIDDNDLIRERQSQVNLIMK